MRRAELAQLKVGNIDSRLMVVHTREGKDQRNRDLPRIWATEPLRALEIRQVLTFQLPSAASAPL